jgi:hypothetical protein
MIQLFVGVVTEGPTDERFLKNILEKAFLDIAYECQTDVEVSNIQFLELEDRRFVEKMISAAREAMDNGMSILCVHSDQDGKDAYNNKINPFIKELDTKDSNLFCKVIIPIIPVKMIEAWMMADRELLKEKIYGQTITDIDLNLHRDPESYANPKETIINAIRIAKSRRPKKSWYDVTISDLYADISSSIGLDKLRILPSFNDFERNVRNAFVKLHYISD